MLSSLLALLAPYVKGTREPEPDRADVVIDAADLESAAQTIRQAGWGYLSAITGLDQGPQTGHLEVLYHFCAGADVLTLRVLLPRTDATLSSLTGIFPSARLFEQELREMFGVAILGLPDTGYLFLPDDWNKAIYPLLKDAPVP